MPTRPLVLVAALFLAALFAQKAPARPTPKPAGPVEVELRAVGEAAPGGDATFEVHVSTEMDVESLVIDVAAPDGFVHTDGPLRWQGAVEQGEDVAFTFSGSLPEETGMTLTVSAVVGAGPARFGDTASLTLGRTPSKPTVADKGRRVLRYGGRVLEIPVE